MPAPKPQPPAPVEPATVSPLPAPTHELRAELVGSELRVDIEHLTLMDRAVLELLTEADVDRRAAGGRFVLDWEQARGQAGESQPALTAEAGAQS